jgi:hypothetical protein
VAVWPWIAGLLAVLAVAAGGYVLLIARDRAPRTGEGGGGPARRGEHPTGAEGALDGSVPPADAPLPPLAESDPLIAGMATGLSARPELAAWLATGALVRRFTAAVDNVAGRLSPRPHLGFAAPAHRFQVAEEGGRLYIHPASYDRYNSPAETFASLDPQACADLYRRLGPLIDEAHAELGYPAGTFDQTLAAAIAELLATPVVEQAIEVTPLVTTYAIADPALEALSPPQKHLLRMGPRNVRMIQAQLRAIAHAIGLGLDAAPPPAGNE